MAYYGDIHLGDTIDIQFTSTSASTGAPTTLSGTPVISAYIGNSTTQLTAGITLSVDFDGVTGLNNVRIVASSGNGYAAATNVGLVITTGTVGGTSAVGYVVGSFSIDNRSVARINGVATSSVTTVNANLGTTQPINFTGTAGSALTKADMVDIAGAAVSTSTAQVGVNVVNIKGTASAGTAGYVAPDFTTVTIPLGIVKALGWVDNGTLQSATATGAVIRSAAAFGDNTLAGHTIWITGGTGIGQSQLIQSNVGSTDTLVVTPGWVTTPDSTSTYAIYPTPPGNTGSPVRTGLAQGGAATSITLDAGASASNSYYNNDLIVITGGTGVGQSRFITAYVGSTKVATVATWVTNPDTTSTFAIIPFDAVAGATAPTVAQIATGVWQDATAGDFTVSGSIGKSLFTSGNAPGASSGIALVGSNMGTVSSVTGAVGSVTGAVGSVTGNVGGNVTGSVGSVAARIGIKKNTALANYPFLMTDATTNAPKPGLTVTATRRIDAGAFSACANAVSEIGNGWYTINFAATDLNGDTIAFKATATGANQCNITFVTQA